MLCQCSGIGEALLSARPHKEVGKILEKKGLPEFTDKTLTSPRDLFLSLSEIQSTGWLLDDEERFIGMRCVAACIHDANGTTIAGVSISGPTLDYPTTRFRSTAKK